MTVTKKAKSLFLSFALCISSILQAQDIGTTLSKLNFDTSIQYELNSGLTDIAKESSWNESSLMELFARMNSSLQTEYKIDTSSADDLYAYMDFLDKNVPYNVSVEAITTSNYQTANATTYMHNALYLALMGKTIKNYLLVKHGINLAEHTSYLGAFNALSQTSDWKITQRFLRLKSLLAVFHIKLEWLPEMLEQM